MPLESIIAFAIAQFAIAFTPGAAVAIVVSLSVREGLSAGLLAVAGLIAANLCFFALVGLGLGTLAHAYPFGLKVVQWIGAAYLIYLGVRLIQSAAPDRVEISSRPGHASPFLQGFVTQISNPKAILFFGAFLPPFIDPARPQLPQYAILAVINVVCDTFSHSVYAFAASYGARRVLDPGVGRWLNIAAGLVFVMIGVLFALSGFRS